MEASKIDILQQEVDRLQHELQAIRLWIEADAEKTKLIDRRFLHRAFAVLGHSLIAQVIVLAPIGLLILLLYLLGVWN